MAARPLIAAQGEILDTASERELLQHAAGGDSAAFRLLVARHLPRLRALAFRVLNNWADADDIVQECFIRLWNNAAKLKVDAVGVGPWLVRVVSNLAIDRIRARRDVSPDALDELETSASQQSDLEAQDLAREVASALAQLPERQALAICLFHYEGYSLKEVSETLDSSPEAIESLLARARRQLRNDLKERWRDLLPAELAN